MQATLPTHAALLDPPLTHVLLDGANHCGVCDENNPMGSAADASEPTIAQADATRKIVGELRGVELAEVRAFVATTPVMTRERAEPLRAELEGLGAPVELWSL